YGRFDLAWRGTGAPKLLEYNADTPTALIEAAVAQWEWLTACVPGGDQWNSLHERLVTAWKSFAPKLDNRLVHFVSMETPEDLATVTYLQDCAEQAGLRTRFLPVSRIGWDHARRAFVDEEGDSLATCFKLYPWEWMVREEFAARLSTQPAYGPSTQWIEPAWKMVLSNKGLLPILWEMFPGHPNLLEAHFAAGKMKSYVQKPLLSREGANIRLVLDGVEVARGVDDGYGKEGFIEQALTPEAVVFDGKWPVLGCWVVQGEAAGLGVREADTMITGPGSRFVPHRMG
ncbi:MAG: glutathionylspermidine synthase family protein, partial [Deltaproteobacteria bacterium]|nr:glutathionylspermidine synthase family protein [Deltaproteobacteria bacterium]